MQRPTSIRQYQILEVLGQGEICQTLLVEDSNSPTLRHCVLRQYRPAESERESLAEKFAQEVNLWSHLGASHSQIPQIYDSFEEQGCFCVVQEWIDGTTLTALVQEAGSLSERRVKEIVVGLLPLLNALHNQGVVYGQLTPDHLLLNKRGLPVLIGMGRLSALMGTTQELPLPSQPQKLAVREEQFSWQRGTYYRDDLYHLGLTAIYLLTGIAPDQFPLNRLTGEILWRDPDLKISAHLAEILDQAVQPDPSDRYDNAKDLLHDLQSKRAIQAKRASAYGDLFDSDLPKTPLLPISPVAIVSSLIGIFMLIAFSSCRSVEDEPPIDTQSPAISPQSQTEESLESVKTEPINPLDENLSTLKPSSPPTQRPSEPQIPPDGETPQNLTPLTPTAPKPTPTSLVTPTPKPESPAPRQTPSTSNYLDLNSSSQSWRDQMPDNSIVLTFDDGPHPEYTPQVLDILKRHDIKATFFLVGKRVEAQCNLVKRIVAEGHEVANHSYTHPFFVKDGLTSEQQQQELKLTQDAITACVGSQVIPRWFRSPYGNQNQITLDIAHKVGLNTALWTIDTQDWNQETTTEKITQESLTSKGKDIILLHDSTESTVDFAHRFQHPKAAKTRQATVDALDPMIEQFKTKNMQFLTLSEAFLDS